MNIFKYFFGCMLTRTDFHPVPFSLDTSFTKFYILSYISTKKYCFLKIKLLSCSFDLIDDTIIRFYCHASVKTMKNIPFLLSAYLSKVNPMFQFPFHYHNAPFNTFTQSSSLEYLSPYLAKVPRETKLFWRLGTYRQFRFLTLCI